MKTKIVRWSDVKKGDRVVLRVLNIDTIDDYAAKVTLDGAEEGRDSEPWVVMMGTVEVVEEGE